MVACSLYHNYLLTILEHSLGLAQLSPTHADSYVRRGKNENNDDGELELVMKAGKMNSPLAPLPSGELRKAIIAFRQALTEAVAVVNVRKRLSTMNVQRNTDAGDIATEEEE